MRLTEVQIKAVRDLFIIYFMKEDSIWLFGSRADDTKKGGDIDLYIETNYDDPAINCQKGNRIFNTSQKNNRRSKN